VPSISVPHRPGSEALPAPLLCCHVSFDVFSQAQEARACFAFRRKHLFFGRRPLKLPFPFFPKISPLWAEDFSSLMFWVYLLCSLAAAFFGKIKIPIGSFTPPIPWLGGNELPHSPHSARSPCPLKSSFPLYLFSSEDAGRPPFLRGTG